MKFTISEIGALCVLAFGVFHYLGIFVTFRAILAFVGTVIVGSSGFIGHVLTWAATWIQQTFGSIMQWLIGVPFAAGFFLVLAIVLFHDLHPKQGARKRTGLIAISAGACLVAGVVGIPALSGVHSLILQLIGNAQTALNGA